ncbi:TetR/AcrR family transcriptional regulator C-terminal domain-containing protein [Streptomyces sp. NPDC059863]|uniref:TetR/AcrR family transcriptional regulator C-terminal domain-containing protein n=1 Tax=unclassified Streptomyces TaxID=2593676 RepID=UPI003663AF43
MSAMSLRFYEVLRRHPNVVPALIAQVPIGPNGLALRERVLRALLERGMPADLAAHAFTAAGTSHPNGGSCRRPRIPVGAAGIGFQGSALRERQEATWTRPSTSGSRLCSTGWVRGVPTGSGRTARTRPADRPCRTEDSSKSPNAAGIGTPTSPRRGGSISSNAASTPWSRAPGRRNRPPESRHHPVPEPCRRPVRPTRTSYSKNWPRTVAVSSSPSNPARTR